MPNPINEASPEDNSMKIQTVTLWLLLLIPLNGLIAHINEFQIFREVKDLHLHVNQVGLKSLRLKNHNLSKILKVLLFVDDEGRSSHFKIIHPRFKKERNRYLKGRKIFLRGPNDLRPLDSYNHVVFFRYNHKKGRIMLVVLRRDCYGVDGGRVSVVEC